MGSYKNALWRYGGFTWHFLGALRKGTLRHEFFYCYLRAGKPRVRARVGGERRALRVARHVPSKKPAPSNFKFPKTFRMPPLLGRMPPPAWEDAPPLLGRMPPLLGRMPPLLATNLKLKPSIFHISKTQNGSRSLGGSIWPFRPCFGT